MKQTATPQEILDAMCIPLHKTSFAIGIFEKRINIYSQQVRALNLAYALIESFRENIKMGLYIYKKPCVAVVGGGISGITFTAALATREIDVHLYEESEIEFTRQRDSDRYIHPNINRWPEKESFEEKANLPLMDWEAGTIKNILNKFEDKWDSEKSFKKNIKPFINCEVKKIRQKEGEHFDYTEIIFLDKKTNTERRERYHAVIYAGGFGEEKQEMNLQTSYWSKDNFKHLVLKKEAEKEIKIRIYGNGDSGLIDVVRIALKKFEDYRIIQNYLTKNNIIHSFGQKMKEFDDKLLEKYFESIKKLDEELKEEFESGLKKKRDIERKKRLEIIKNEVSNQLNSKVEELYEKEYEILQIANEMTRYFHPNKKIKITLIGNTPTPYTLDSLLINRLLIFMLSKTLPSGFQYIQRVENQYKKDCKSRKLSLNNCKRVIANLFNITPKSYFLKSLHVYTGTVLERSGPERIYKDLFYDESDEKLAEDFDNGKDVKINKLKDMKLNSNRYWEKEPNYFIPSGVFLKLRKVRKS